jgi:metal-responsive CopG/Arc/MetJ family transcriptional regulator
MLDDVATTPLVALRIPADLTARLDQHAAARGMSRSEAIRDAIATALEADAHHPEAGAA